MDALALTAIQLAVIWAVSTGIVWASVRLVGRRLKMADAASVAFIGSLLSLLLTLLGGILGVFLLWTVLLWFLCRLSLWRAAISSALMQLLALIVFRIII